MKRQKNFSELYKLFTKIKNTQDAKLVLEDLLTPQEIEDISERWEIIKMLQKAVPQREISKKLKVSISKVTRGSSVLQYGTGGFELLLRRMAR